MIVKNIKLIGAIITFNIFIGFGCTYKQIIEPKVSQELVSFKSDIIPIFENNCISCHSTQSIPPVLLSQNAFLTLTQNSYLNTDIPEDSRLMVKVNSNHPNQLSPTSFEKQVLLQWIKEGANNN